MSKCCMLDATSLRIEHYKQKMSSQSISLLSSTKPKKTMTQATLTGFGNLIKLLPTGTVFTYHFLNPVLTNNGRCNTVQKYLSGILIVVCGLSCWLSSFTDSYTDSEGKTHYGIATTKGLWPNPASLSAQDLSSYKLRFGDFVRAFLALLVFSVVALLYPNSVECFYPSFESTQKALLVAMPPVVGMISVFVFALFPNTRHGIGHPSSQDSAPSSTIA